MYSEKQAFLKAILKKQYLRRNPCTLLQTLFYSHSLTNSFIIGLTLSSAPSFTLRFLEIFLLFLEMCLTLSLTDPFSDSVSNSHSVTFSFQSSL